jgi:hypothetical protein
MESFQAWKEAVGFQPDTTSNHLEFKLREAAISGREKALSMWIEEAKTKEAALTERERELRELQETLEQTRQDCQAWEDRLKILESHLHEREEKIKEREQVLKKALRRLQAQDVTSTTKLHGETSSSLRFSHENVTADFTSLQGSSDPAVAVDKSVAGTSQTGGDRAVSESGTPLTVTTSVSMGKMKPRRRGFGSGDGGGGGRAGNDEAAKVERMEQELKEIEEFAQKFAKNVVDWEKSKVKEMHYLKLWTLSFSKVIGISADQGSEAFDAFLHVVEGQLVPLTNKLWENISERVLKSIAALLATMTKPSKLLARMNEQEPLHHRLLNMPSSPKKRPPPNLLEASTAYLALRTQLLNELPKYIDCLHRGLGVCILRLAEVQKEHWGDVRECLGDLWEMLRVEGEKDVNSGAKDTVAVWFSKWVDVDEVAQTLGITRSVVRRVGRENRTLQVSSKPEEVVVYVHEEQAGENTSIAASTSSLETYRRSPAQRSSSPSRENMKAKFENVQVLSRFAEAVDGNVASISQDKRGRTVSANVGLQPSANQVKDSKSSDKRSNRTSSMPSSVISSIRGSTQANFRNMGIANVGPQPSANQVRLSDGGFGRTSTVYSMTSSVMPSIRSSTTDQANPQRTIERSETSTVLSQHQRRVLGYHTSQWSNLDSIKFITWNDIPWPTFVKLTRPEELRQGEVEIYLKLLGEFEYRTSPKSRTFPTSAYDSDTQENSIEGADDFLVKYIARWHPDRLEVRVYSRVTEQDKETVRVYASKVFGILQRIQARVDESEGMEPAEAASA